MGTSTHGVRILKGRGSPNKTKGARRRHHGNETWPGVWTNAQPWKRSGSLGPFDKEEPWLKVVGIVQDVKHELTAVTRIYLHTPRSWSSMGS